MKELHPVNQQVIIDISVISDEQRTAGGIIIPDTAKEKPTMAPIKWISNIPNAEVAPGDIVVFKKYSGTEIEFDGKKYLVIPYADLLAKVVETEEI